jgi:hypothetical protein
MWHGSFSLGLRPSGLCGFERRRQKLIVAVVEATPPGGRVEEQRPDGTRLIVTTMAPLTGGFPAEARPATTTLTSATSTSTSTTQ